MVFLLNQMLMSKTILLKVIPPLLIKGFCRNVCQMQKTRKQLQSWSTERRLCICFHQKTGRGEKDGQSRGQRREAAGGGGQAETERGERGLLQPQTNYNVLTNTNRHTPRPQHPHLRPAIGQKEGSFQPTGGLQRSFNK